MFRETVTREEFARTVTRSEAGTDQKDVFHTGRAASITPLDYPNDRSLEAHRQVNV
jgi:hypothetical protein